MSQLNESATKGVTKHTAKDGGYGRKGDDENTDTEAPKVGKDTPKGDIFGRTTGKVPASAKTKKEKKGLKEYFSALDKAIAEGALDNIRAGSPGSSLANIRAGSPGSALAGVRNSMAQRGAGAPAMQRTAQAAQQRLGQIAGRTQQGQLDELSPQTVAKAGEKRMQQDPKDFSAATNRRDPIVHARNQTKGTAAMPVSEMGEQPRPVFDQGNKQAGVGVVKSNNPTVQNMLNQLKPNELQIVMKGQQGQQQSGTQPMQQSMSTSGGATNQPMAEEGGEKWIQGAIKHPGALRAKLHAKPGEPIPAGKLEKATHSKNAKTAKQARLAQTLRKMHEGDIPPQDGLLGAGLGAGRSQGVTEGSNNLPGNQETIDVAKPKGKIDAKDFAALRKKTKVKESMNTRIKEAYHMGKAHGMGGHAHMGNNYEDMEEARMYHHGYKEGLDECYGQVPIQGLTVADEGMNTVDDIVPATVPGMADATMDEGNAFTKALAKTPKGGKFSVAGTDFTDTSNYDAKVFESWDNQLSSLLEEYNTIQEGISVSVSKGQQGAPDSVSVTAQDGDADKLLQIVKHAGLGLFGDEGGPAEVGVPSGGEQHGGVDVVGDHDGMMALIKKSTGGEQPGTLEPADDEGSGELDALKQLTQAISGGAPEQGSDEDDSEEDSEEEEVEEDDAHMGGPADETSDEYMNQEEEQVAESEDDEDLDDEDDFDDWDPLGGYGSLEELLDDMNEFLEHEARHKFYNIDKDKKLVVWYTQETDPSGSKQAARTIAKVMSENGFNGWNVLVTNRDNMGSAVGVGNTWAKAISEDNPPDTGAEEFAEIDAETAEDNAAASSHGGAQNSNLEEGGEECDTCGESKCTCDEEQVEESYANSDDDGFQADIDFMTKMISGGLNKQKSTGQTTAPIIAGQDDRMGYSVKESVSDWKKLAGI